MADRNDGTLNRRLFLGAAAGAMSALALPAYAQTAGEAEMEQDSTQMEADITATAPVRHNISSFTAKNWQDYFSDTHNGAILVDTTSRALHFWSADKSIYKLYPTSVPMSPDLTRKGRTSIIRKVMNPSWAPTPAMKKRDPSWPDYIPPGPENPLGTRALYLTWQYYRIHGTQDTRKIGRLSSNGCIGLYNEDIEALFDLTKVGTQVLLI